MTMKSSLTLFLWWYSLLAGSLVLFQDALFHQLLSRRAALKLLIQAVSPHVLLQTLLIGLNAGSRIAVGEDVAFNIR